jgi:hypothetical protein
VQVDKIEKRKDERSFKAILEMAASTAPITQGIHNVVSSSPIMCVELLVQLDIDSGRSKTWRPKRNVVTVRLVYSKGAA